MHLMHFMHYMHVLHPHMHHMHGGIYKRVDEEEKRARYCEMHIGDQNQST